MATGNEYVMIRLMVDALEAVIAYDASIMGAAARGEVEYTEEGIAFSETEDMDQLYLNMTDKSKIALEEFEKWQAMNLQIPTDPNS